MRAAADLLNADRLDELEQAMVKLRADARVPNSTMLEAAAVWTLAQAAYQRGELARAELDARACLALPFGPVARLAPPVLVLVLAETGAFDEAEQVLDDAGLLGALPTTTTMTAAYGARGRRGSPSNNATPRPPTTCMRRSRAQPRVLVGRAV